MSILSASTVCNYIVVDAKNQAEDASVKEHSMFYAFVTCMILIYSRIMHKLQLAIFKTGQIRKYVDCVGFFSPNVSAIKLLPKKPEVALASTLMSMTSHT
jgi:hypothetical protein